MKRTKIFVVIMTLAIFCVPFNAHAASNGNEIIGGADFDTSAIFEVDTTQKVIPPSLTRMPSIAGGKTQVMSIAVTSLKSGNYLTTYSSGKSLPAKSETYWAICTSRTSGTTANVGLCFYNSRGELMSSGRRASVSGVDTYGWMQSNSQYKNYGYVENTGSSKLAATYVIMK